MNLILKKLIEFEVISYKFIFEIIKIFKSDFNPFFGYSDNGYRTLCFSLIDSTCIHVISHNRKNPFFSRGRCYFTLPGHFMDAILDKYRIE